MTYFTKELLRKLNDFDETIRKQAEKEWSRNDITYCQQFERIKNILSHKFIQEFFLRDGLHDYIILDITVTRKNKSYSCAMLLANGSDKVLITMRDLTSMKINFDSLLACKKGELKWAYSEFDILSKKNIRLAVLCDTENEMEFQFKSIKMSKQ